MSTRALSSFVLALAGVALAAEGAAAAQPLVLSIGFNGVPADAENQALVPLRFADDDAVAVNRFAAELGGRSWLLTAPDADTERRFASARTAARPPTLGELKRAVSEINAAARAQGDDVSVLVFYSGHGTRTSDGQTQLTLADGGITHTALYEILGQLKVRTVHLLVDACHAEAVVRPRDTQARVVEVSPTEAGAYFARQTLARFPHVGAIVGATLGAQAHEWDVYQGGVFTHQVLSALRGAADVNGDGGIEYSEVAAFLAAANREVADPRARMRAIVRAPSAQPHAPLVQIARSGLARLRGKPAWLGAFYVETMQGLRVAELRAEAGHQVELVLPSGLPLYLRGAAGEAEVTLLAGERRSFESLSFGPPSSVGRGAIESSLKRGLFAASFGPSYYRGFVDRNDEIVPVALAALELVPRVDASPTAGAPSQSRWVALGAAVGLTAGAGFFGARAWSAKSEFDSTRLERASLDANERYERNRNISALLLGGAVVSGVAWYFLSRDAP
jgi:hypothetical protein